MNNWIGIGNLTKDPELRYSTGQNQTAICRFTLAINDKRKNPQTQEWEDNPSFIPVVVFGKQAENCVKYLAKGKKVAVSGRIQTGSYEKDGQKVYTTDVVANGVEFLSPAQEAQQAPVQQYQQPIQQPVPDQQYQQPVQQQAPVQDQGLPPGFEQVDNDDIPF